ncbi:flavin reductase family protein [Chryseolinea soli]|uniref:Flavin reductase n=1 Tax=Chryseolinea soli TaxID=2321403 RepID=A0A385SHF1_9BACT|nr:flavin reductase family protein [Chryseolinea soli]AYB31163.1 flavin reductase [Chryseolinea soli]
MKALLKSIAKRVLFGNRVAKSFPAVRIPIGKVEEKVFLSWPDGRLDISERHCIVCHAPFCLSVWLTPEEWRRVETNVPTISVTTGEKIHAELITAVVKKIDVANGFLVVVKAEKAFCHQKSAWFQYFIRRYFKNKNSAEEDKFYAAAYSYPRRVIAVSFRDESYYNIFPMDFQCHIPQSGLYVLGLRTTNITLQKIIQSEKIVIGDTDGAELSVIYALGNNHSSQPPSIEQLPFTVSASEAFHFPVPDFSASYKEIRLIGHYNLGTHTMLVGEIVNAREVREKQSYLYHISFLQSLGMHYTSA